MKVIVAGSRGYTNQKFIYSVLNSSPWNISEVVCGEAKGPDTIGRQWAESVGKTVTSFPADWDTHGKSAGPIRNAEMAAYADAVIIFISKSVRSNGSRHMLKEAISKNLHLMVIWVD